LLDLPLLEFARHQKELPKAQKIILAMEEMRDKPLKSA
jgi:hypothetical protein